MPSRRDIEYEQGLDGCRPVSNKIDARDAREDGRRSNAPVGRATTAMPSAAAASARDDVHD